MTAGALNVRAIMELRTVDKWGQWYGQPVVLELPAFGEQTNILVEPAVSDEPS